MSDQQGANPQSALPPGKKVQVQIGTWMASLVVLMHKGLRIGSFIDLGCADGYHGLAMWAAGPLQNATVVNIDANPIYETSLKKIKAGIGGDYRICAVAEKDGTVEMKTSAHPYWASAADSGDTYWSTVNNQLGETKIIPSRTLDSLVAEIKPPTPHVIKLDIQGLEAQVLRSGPKTLANTAVVVVEILMYSFRDINAELEKAGMELYDIVDMNRTSDHGLGWFLGVYLHKNYQHLRSTQVWNESSNEQVKQAQVVRRDQLLKEIDATLAKIAARPKA